MNENEYTHTLPAQLKRDKPYVLWSADWPARTWCMHSCPASVPKKWSISPSSVCRTCPYMYVVPAPVAPAGIVKVPYVASPKL